MTFGLNGPTPPKGIQEAQNMRNNGGGGNLGYFQRGKQKKKKKEEDDVDMFSRSVDDEDFLLEENLADEHKNGLKFKILGDVADKFKKFFK